MALTEFPEIPPLVIESDQRLGQQDLVPLSVVNRLLQDNSVSTAKIQNLAVTNAKINDLAADKITTGTLSVVVGVGTGQVSIDGANKRILINDGTNDRILIGYQASGF